MHEQSVTGFWIHIDWRLAAIGAAFASVPWWFMLAAQFASMVMGYRRQRILRRAIKRRKAATRTQ